MEKNSEIVYCADVIARYEGFIVIVERLGSVRGLALPGGKQEPGESLTRTAKREFEEETGLKLEIEETLCTRAEEGRDPRGRYVSTIFLGTATGEIREEPGKTKILLIHYQKLAELKNRFVFDHADVLDKYYLHLF